MAVIQTNNLSKIFRVHKKAAGFRGSLKALVHREWIDKCALQNVSIQVSAGEILGLVGANGAGKTTLVKILAGIVCTTSGEVSVLSHNPWDRSNELRRQVALIMGQKAQLWWDLPAEDCFLLLREIYQIPPAQYRQNLEYLVESLGVRDQMNIQIRRLSLGERMKMELVAALLHTPKVVYLDEPTIGLDLTAQRAIRKFILEYRKIHRPAMILTSHYMEDIEQLCERIAIIKEGQIVYDGALSRVVNTYAKHKILTLKWEDSGGEGSAKFSSLVRDLKVEVVREEPSLVQLKVDRADVKDVASYLLQKIAVKDLSIEEEDIGNIIEKLIRRDSPSIRVKNGARPT